MKALVCHRITDDFSGLELRDIAVPEPGEGEVLVRVKAAGVNFPDLLMSQGKYQFKPELPFTLGMEVAGVIEAVGEGVTEWKPDDAVIGGNKTGAYGEYAVLPAASLPACMPRPPRAACAKRNQSFNPQALLGGAPRPGYVASRRQPFEEIIEEIATSIRK